MLLILPIYAPEFRSTPLIENAYCPFRLAFEKFPAGGGGVIVDPLPPQAARQPAITNPAS
jgi:hypothetical protein